MKLFGIEFGKRSELIRDNKGNVVRGIKYHNIERYLGAFNSVLANKNYVALFDTIAELQFPIRAIAERSLNAKFYLKDYDTDSIVWNNEKINKFLSQPNELQSFDEYFQMAMSYYLLIGGTYLYSDIPDTLRSLPRWQATDNYYVLPSDQIEIITEDSINLYSGEGIENIIKHYEINYNTGRKIFPTNNVLNIKDLNLKFDKKILKGRSRLESLDYPLSNLCAVYEARNAIYTKRGALGLLVSKKTDESGSVAITKKEKEQVLKAWFENYGTEGSKSNLAISDVPMEFVKLGISIQELQPFDETLADAITIAGAFNVPSDMIPRKDKSTFSNHESSEKSLYENMVIPLTNKFITAINNWLGLSNSIGGMYLYADFSEIPCLQANRREAAQTQKLKSDTALTQYEKGAITYNEMRVEIGKEKIPNGDYYVWQDKNKINNNLI